MFQFLISVVSNAVMAFITGESITDAMMSGLAESTFWGGVFAFVSASVNAVKTVARTYAQGGKACDVVGQCFIAGTLVLCMDEDGNECHKPIEDIKVGDKVWAYDEETGENDWKPVVSLFRNQTKEWYHVFVDGEEIVCTGGHPFYVLNAENDRKHVLYENAKLDTKGKWICAQDLKIGDQILTSDGTCAIIDKIQVEQLSKPETTYNFEVADFHTYYVCDSKMLVHNRCVTAIKNDTAIARDIVGEGPYGTYDITYSSGEHYIGKGGQARMWKSASIHETGNLKVTAVKWRSATGNFDAFIQEAKWMNAAGWGGKGNRGILLNIINSPGHKFL